MASGHQFKNRSLRNRPSFAIKGSTHSRCTRCGGLLVQGDFLNLMKGAVKQEDIVIRCIQCGDLVDRIIFQNRTRPISPIG